MERKVFRGVGVMIVNPITHRRFHVVAKSTPSQVINFDPARFFEVNLDQTPSRAASWSDVNVDDRGIDPRRMPLAGGPCVGLLTGYHVTSIGGYVAPDRPDDLIQGCFVGAVYLEDGYFQRVRDKIDLPGDPWPGDGRKPHQLTTISYSDHMDNGAQRKLRYAGFDARVVQRLGGSRLRVEMLGALDRAPVAQLDLDLASPAHCDPDPPVSPGEPALTADAAQGSCGALFVELGQLALCGVENPKLPIGLGA
jgi:hypothetical protein